MKLSIVVIFYNMRREAERTLYSLSNAYQLDSRSLDYEVIAVDNGSTEPLVESDVTRFGSNFRYYYNDTSSPSPCAAINWAVDNSDGEYVMCCIDGARILSPGILYKTVSAAGLYPSPFIYTIGMHLGDKIQNESINDGYNQEAEDDLLETVDWKKNGYSLFDISCLAGSSRHGYYGDIAESNCFALKKEEYLRIGGYNELFTSPGGGICNLDIFKRATNDNQLTPVLLMGEATFHQFHGGVATNVKLDEHNFKQMKEEYYAIYGHDWAPGYKSPVYYGDVCGESRRFM
jgi:glycosyltransferase involved in cell wall biosynthesis